jgi:hypothetical protein
MQRVLCSSSWRLVADSPVLRLSQRFASTENLPAGHHNSDLSSTACNIGLNRRRDISLRQDITVFLDGHSTRMADIFKVLPMPILQIPTNTPGQMLTNMNVLDLDCTACLKWTLYW